MIDQSYIKYLKYTIVIVSTNKTLFNIIKKK